MRRGGLSVVASAEPRTLTAFWERLVHFEAFVFGSKDRGGRVATIFKS